MQSKISIVKPDRHVGKHVNGFEESKILIHNGDSVKKEYQLLYNRIKNICIKDPECHSHLPEILQVLSTTLPKDAITWVPIDIARKDFVKVANTFISNGFSSPYINTITPHSLTMKPSVCLSLHADNPEKNHKMTLHKVYDVLKQYKNNEGVCYINVQLTPEAVKVLSNTPFSGFVKNKNGKTSQKELSGELHLENVVPKDDKFVYMIGVNHSTIEHGEDEAVSVLPLRFNFHSHPRQAYIRNGVKKAWPSVVDYLGYLTLGKNTVFHIVACIEGMYVISFTPYWSQRIDNIDERLKKFVDKNFEIEHSEPYTIEEYIGIVNNIKYKDGPNSSHAIFHVDFFDWNNAGNVFSVFFPQIGSSCLVSQKIVNKYKRLHH